MKLGLLPYINTFPVTLGLQQGHIVTPKSLEIVTGHPTSLNALSSQGQLTVTSVSSIQWLACIDQYRVVPGLCIASSGPVRSVQLFSRVPLSQLRAEQVGVTGASATSCMLLRLVRPDLLQSPMPLTHFPSESDLSAEQIFPAQFRAVLLIGDLALRFAQNPENYCECLDLGQAWRDMTGLPTVYALWLARRESAVQQPVSEITELLSQSRYWGQEHIPQISQYAAERIGLSPSVCQQYYQGLGYHLGSNEVEGLIEFYRRSLHLEGKSLSAKVIEELRLAATPSLSPL